MTACMYAFKLVRGKEYLGHTTARILMLILQGQQVSRPYYDGMHTRIHTSFWAVLQRHAYTHTRVHLHQEKEDTHKREREREREREDA